ncbi:MAG: trigger factor [Parvibaculales bacterium]
MNVQELSADGLSREIKITISRDDLNTQLDVKIDELKDTVQLKGFRKGKVPAQHLKKLYGQQVMGDIVQELVNARSQQALSDRDERPALQPEVKLDGDVEKVMSGEADLVFDMAYDIIPPIELADFSKIKLERQVAEVSKQEVEESMQRLAESRKQFEPRGKTAKAKDGDSVKIDFLGKIDDEPFEGGASEGFDLELGSGQFIPGFEEQLVGTKAGDTLDVNVTFPEEYNAEHLAGKAAVFEVTVHEVSAPKAAELNDEFATTLGMESLEKLEEAIEEQISRDYGQFSRDRLKRSLLDQLSDTHDFELPGKMVELEFNQIWHQFEHEIEGQGKKIDDLDETEDELRSEYRDIAERRVRTGLVLAEVGSSNEIDVTQEEINQGLMQRVQQFPGQEQQVFEYFRSNPEAMAQIRAPIFEDKVIDFIIEKADVTDKTVSVEELMKNPDEEETVKAKPKKKAAAKKKPAAKKTAAKKPADKKPAAKKKATKKKDD